MSKPANYVDWAKTYDVYTGTGGTYDGQPNKLAVTSGQLDNGWEPGKKPPAENMNAWQNMLGQWVRWFDSADQEAQRTIVSRAAEALNHAASPMTSNDVSTSKFVFALSPNRAALIQGSANNKIKVSAGVLFQAVSASLLLPYSFDGTDEVTIAVNASPNPRVDIVQVKIEPDATIDGVRTKKTISVKQGTNGGTTTACTVPALDPGYVAIATVLVGGSYAAAAAFLVDDTAGAVAVIHDQRMPLGEREFGVASRDFSYTAYNSGLNVGWTLDTALDTLTAAGATPFPIALGARNEHAGRLLAGDIVCKAAGSPSPAVVTFQRIGVDSSGAAYQVSLNTTGIVLSAFVLNTSIGYGVFESRHAPGAGPTVTASSDAVGVPVWTNGHRCWTLATGAVVSGSGGWSQAALAVGGPSLTGFATGDAIYRGRIFAACGY